MNEKIEFQVQDTIEKIRTKQNVLHFSCGADSIAAHLRMIEWGINPILIYRYYIDGLPLVENFISYYEKTTGCKIYKLPAPVFWDDYENGLYQIPGVGLPMYKEIKKLGWGNYTKESYDAVLEEVYPNICSSLGIRVTDGINRAISIKKFGPYHNNKFYPIASFTLTDVKDIIKKHGIKLPLDYSLFGISFESPRWWMMPILKNECPETYKKILEYFPMAKLMVAQYEAIGKGMPGNAQKRISSYKGMSMDKGCLIW